MKLVSTTDKDYQDANECNFAYFGHTAIIDFDDSRGIHTTKVKQITREGNIVVITTENNTYILED